MTVDPVVGAIILVICVVAFFYGLSRLDQLLSRRERGLGRRKRKKIGKGEDEK